MILIAITGASGVIYGIKLLEELNKLNIETGLIISDAAKIVIETESNYSVDDVIQVSDN